jgi:hypothetical protein
MTMKNDSGWFFRRKTASDTSPLMTIKEGLLPKDLTEIITSLFEKYKIHNINELENRKEQLLKELNKDPEFLEWSVRQFFKDCLSQSIRKENGELQDWIYDEVRKKDILDDQSS